MTPRRTIGLVLATNLVIATLVIGLFYVPGLALAGPAAQTGRPPVSLAFPLYQDAEDRVNTVLPALPGARVDVGTLYQSFAATSFHPRSSNGVKTVNADSHCLYADEVAGNPATEPLIVPLVLPQGAVITEIFLYYKRGGTSDQMALDLKRSNMLGTVDTPAMASTSGNTAGYQTTSSQLSPTITVDNGAFAYFLGARLNHLGSGLQLCGARVAYTMQSAMTPIISYNAQP